MSESLALRRASNAGRFPFPPWPFRFVLREDPFPFREDALWPRRLPELCDFVVFWAISPSSSAALGLAAFLLAALAKVLESLLGALPNVLDPLLRALAQALDALLGALAQALDTLLRALAQALDTLLGAAAETGDSLPGPTADALDRALRALPGAFDHVACVAEQIVGSAADVAECLPDAL